MSYYRGGGRRRNNNYRDEEEERRNSEVFETPDQQLKSSIIKYGDVDIVQEVSRLCERIKNHRHTNLNAIAEGFRISVTEQPYKTPYYANLIKALDEGSEGPDSELLGKLVLDDFWKGFQAYLDKLAWREVRLCVHFFAHLTNAQVISAPSLLALLQAFTAVLDEFGVSHGRAKNAALCAVDGLLRAGATLKAYASTEVTNLINSIENYAETVSTNKFIVSSFTILHAEVDRPESADEALDAAIAVLKKLDESDFTEVLSSLPQPYASSVTEESSPYFDLPSVLVPPEVIELEGLGEGEDSTAGTPRQEEWPEYRLNLFDNDVTADPVSPIGYVVNTAISDIIDIFEVNRKECARLLLELPKWMLRGTFKPRPGVPWDDGETPGPKWQLESCVMENILSKLLLLPKPIHKPLYYISLIAELSKLSPSTVGPALGKSIRKLYALLGDGLDVHAAQHFVEWFGTHMSNFGFQWVWKEWVPDLSLPNHHPKHNFIRRAIEIEIRLAYHERILNTLPEPFRAPSAGALPEHAPGPEFEFEEPLNPHHDSTQSILNLLRGRSKPEEVLTHLDTLKSTMPDTITNREGEEVPININSVIRAITTQCLLHIGARSFSHLLNAIERYLPVLRVLASGTISSSTTVTNGPGVGDADAKADILLAVSEFWRRNLQMINIVFDKLMQYQIVDPSDVVAWAFTNSGRIAGGEKISAEEATTKIDAFVWGIIEDALDKANGRVAIAKRKVTALRKEEDDSRARDIAKGGDVGNMDVDAVDTGAATNDAEKPADSPQLISALKVQSVLIREQKMVLSRTLNEFVRILSETSESPILREEGWHNRANWGNDEWETWETWGWYRNFCRVYAPYLRNYSTSLSAVAFERIGGSTDPAATLIRRVWGVTAGDDS